MRTFVAIPIPREGRAQHFLEACQNRLKQAGGDVRWTNSEQWHITIRFLGETSEEQMTALRRAVEKAAHEVEPFEARLQEWGVFPERGAPRGLWAGADADPWPREGFRGSMFEALRGFLDWALREAGYPNRRDRLAPHVTLARVKPPKDIGPLLDILRNEPPPPGAAFTATRITLFQSVLSPDGSTYIPLLEAPLGK